jgi:hypothetical protein
MVAVNSMREFHSELSTVCTALESLFRLAGPDYEEIGAAVQPALSRFRELLDVGDEIAGPEGSALS